MDIKDKSQNNISNTVVIGLLILIAILISMLSIADAASHVTMMQKIDVISTQLFSTDIPSNLK